jgi:uncharacterized protein YndB with AHSA1/START domain
MTSQESAPPKDIVVEGVLPEPVEKVWKALTTAALIERWLMPNDFEAVVGKRFTFKTKPMGEWDGVVHCEVLEVTPCEKLVYSWKGGADNNAKYGSALDTLVTWTLAPHDGGTHVRLIHSGFRTPENDFAFNAMSPGWMRVLQGIEREAREAA